MKAVDELAGHVGTDRACQALAVSRTSYYRRRSAKSVCEFNRPRQPSPRALSQQERQEVLDVLHSQQFVDQSPREVYASLLDAGRYLCSLRTMYRILDQAQEVRERRNQLRHPRYKKPELLATGPNQVWSWDITKLLGPAKWTYFHLYVILDIFSRYVVGWMVASRESAQLAQRLIRETVDKQQVPCDQLTIHSDRGPSMKSQTVAQLLATLGVVKSHSRPHVSNDNPFSESQFKTLKYRPNFPHRFGSQEDVCQFCRHFFHWYNNEHYHTGIALLTPAMVHDGSAETVVQQRQEVLDAAYAANPERFVRKRPAPQAPPREVWINPPVETRSQQQPIRSQNSSLTQIDRTQPKIELEISPLTSANDLPRLILPVDLALSGDNVHTTTELIQAADPQQNDPNRPAHDDEPSIPQPATREHFLADHCLPSPAEARREQECTDLHQTRYTNFVRQVSHFH